MAVSEHPPPPQVFIFVLGMFIFIQWFERKLPRQRKAEPQRRGDTEGHAGEKGRKWECAAAQPTREVHPLPEGYCREQNATTFGGESCKLLMQSN